jgi:hypothetical protein
MLEIILTIRVRDVALHTSYLGQLTNKGQLSTRYCIIMMPVVVIFWYVFVSKLLRKFNWSIKNINYILICISLYIISVNIDRMFFGNFYYVPRVKLEEKYLWPFNVRLIYNTIHYGMPQSITVPSAPMDGI